jgi:hypothetical protein
MKYTLSFYAKENQPYFKHIKWCIYPFKFVDAKNFLEKKS